MIAGINVKWLTDLTGIFQPLKYKLAIYVWYIKQNCRWNTNFCQLN